MLFLCQLPSFPVWGCTTIPLTALLCVHGLLLSPDNSTAHTSFRTGANAAKDKFLEAASLGQKMCVWGWVGCRFPASVVVPMTSVATTYRSVPAPPCRPSVLRYLSVIFVYAIRGKIMVSQGAQGYFFR